MEKYLLKVILISVIDQDVMSEWVIGKILFCMVPSFKGQNVPVILPKLSCLLAGVKNHEVFVVSVKNVSVSQILRVK